MNRFRLAILILLSFVIAACVVATPRPATATPGPAFTATLTPTLTHTPIATAAQTAVHTSTPTPTTIPTSTLTITATATATATITATATTTATVTTAATPPPYADIEAEMVQAINEQRVKAGLPATRADAGLAETARDHAQDMADRSYYSHTTPEGKTVRDRLTAHGLNPERAGENFYVTSGQPGEVTPKTMDWFMGDPSHRENLLGEHYTRTGVGVVKATNGMYVVVVVLANEEVSSP